MIFKQERTNISVGYLLSFTSWLYFPITAWFFFYSRYLSFAEIALLSSISGIATLLFEIPTGAFADIIGRRASIIISFLIYAVAMLGEAYSTTFWQFAVWTIFAMLATSLLSGSLEALIYDTLVEDGKEDQYDRVISKIEALNWIGLFVSALLSGFMYYYWFRLPYIAQAVVSLIAAGVALMLVEPTIDSKKHNLKDLITQNVQGFKELFHNAKSSAMAILFIILDTGYYISSAILGISQAVEYGLDARSISILFGTGYLLSAVVSFMYPKIRRILGSRYILIVSTVLMLSSFLFAKHVGFIVGSLLIILRIASSTAVNNTRSIVMNRFISSKNRATSLSTLVLLSHLPFTFAAYFVGIYIEKTSPNTFAFLFGWIILATLIVHLFVARKSFNDRKKKVVAI